MNGPMYDFMIKLCKRFIFLIYFWQSYTFNQELKIFSMQCKSKNKESNYIFMQKNKKKSAVKNWQNRFVISTLYPIQVV